VTLSSLLTHALRVNHHVLTPRAQQQLLHYLDLLCAWNRVFNLTRLTTPHQLIYWHLMDSLATQPYLQGTRLLDVGSGAGLPGIPLAIVHPNQHWTLLDKNSKKTRFLTQVMAELGLTNTTIIHCHSHSFHATPGFDSILSRAFGPITLFIEATAHLLHPQGRFIAMKGQYPQAELSALPSRFVLQCVAPLSISGTSIKRHVVCLQMKKDPS
jgi:16S rRNA (guanine527-N7)-methyltransferase